MERLVTDARWLAELAGDGTARHRFDEPLRARLLAVRAECRRLRDALAFRRPAAVGPPVEVPPDAVASGLPTLVASMEQAVGRVAAATSYLSAAEQPRQAPPSSPLDTRVGVPIFLPPFFALARDDVTFALKCASLYQSLLRLAGACLGGLLGLALIVVVMPNTDDRVWFLLPFTACVWIAAWITAESSRISCAGPDAGTLAPEAEARAAHFDRACARPSRPLPPT